MKKSLSYILPALILTGAISCKKVFNPHLNTVTTNFLAVDGPVISGDSTFITLSRTTKLSDTTQNKAELKAQVSVEDDKGKLYAFTEKGKGIYVLGVTIFDPSRQYRLDIKTSDAKVYQSDFVPLKITPPIDSIYFKQNSDATVLFYVNAHDANNNTRYYRWDYKETWSYHSLYTAIFVYDKGNFDTIKFDTPQDLHTCFRTDLSNQLFIGTSEKLARDVISNQVLGGLAANSEKIGQTYVMQLHQYALTQTGYNYYQNIKTNSEQLGSIFDAQPTTTLGNIHCITNPTEMVLGFVSVSTVSAKQLTLRYSDLPIRIITTYDTIDNLINPLSARYFPPPTIDYNICTWPGPPPPPGNTPPPPPPQYGTPWAILFGPGSTFNFRANRTFGKGDTLVINNDVAPGPGGSVIGLYYAPRPCVDCRVKGGTNLRPSYFPPN